MDQRFFFNAMSAVGLEPVVIDESTRFFLPHVVAATQFVGGEIVVLIGDALGAEVGRFPRTLEGHAAAHMLAGFAEGMSF